MTNADTESDGTHAAQIGHVLLHLCYNPAGTPAIISEQSVERIRLIVSPRPISLSKINTRFILDPVVVKRNDKSSLDSLTQTNLMSETAAKVRKNTDAIRTLRSGSEGKQTIGVKAGKKLLVTTCRSMMSFIKHDIIKKIRWPFPGITFAPALHCTEPGTIVFRLITGYVFPETIHYLTENLPETLESLLQNLLAMHEKKKARVRMFLKVTSKVKGCNHRFSRTSGCNNQVAMFSCRPLVGNGVKNLLLIIKRAKLIEHLR